MNKTLLIIICDFLLISLLAVARFDKLEPEEPTTEADPVEQADPESDLLEVLKQSLEEERQVREDLDARLDEARNALEKRESELARQESQLQQTEAELRRKEQEAREAAAAQAALQRQLAANQTNLNRLEQEYSATRTNLALLERTVAVTQASLAQVERQKQATEEQLAQARSQFESSQSDIENLQNKLASAQSESRVNQQLVQALQQDLEQKVQQTAVMQQQISTLDQQREQALIQGQKLSGQLQVAQTESRLTQQQLSQAQQEISTVRQEKETIQKQTTQLAEGVTELATQSSKLTEEIRENRPLSPNQIFQEFNANRVHSSFQATRRGLFGQTIREDKVANTILFTIADKSYALYHINDTPVNLVESPTDWNTFNGTFRHDTAFTPMAQLFFLDRDPRILLSPLTGEQAAKLGVKSYAISKDVLKFESAVVVGATDNYYGECQFRLDPEVPGYMLMDRPVLGRIFGKFAPSRGDLVISKTGELIGMMANNKYCLVLDNPTAARRIRLGGGLEGQYLPALLSQMYYQVLNMPFRLQ